ncbi:hypothetical protein D3C87_2048910 [compost metagenome]
MLNINMPVFGKIRQLIPDQRRIYISRANGIGGDAKFSALQGCDFGEAYHAVFGAVVGYFSRKSHQSVYRRHIDDAS